MFFYEYIFTRINFEKQILPFISKLILLFTRILQFSNGISASQGKPNQKKAPVLYFITKMNNIALLVKEACRHAPFAHFFRQWRLPLDMLCAIWSTGKWAFFCFNELVKIHHLLREFITDLKFP